MAASTTDGSTITKRASRPTARHVDRETLDRREGIVAAEQPREAAACKIHRRRLVRLIAEVDLKFDQLRDA